MYSSSAAGFRRETAAPAGRAFFEAEMLDGTLGVSCIEIFVFAEISEMIFTCTAKQFG